MQWVLVEMPDRMKKKNKHKGKIAVKYMDGSSLLLICVCFKVGDNMG